MLIWVIDTPSLLEYPIRRGEMLFANCLEIYVFLKSEYYRTHISYYIMI